MARSAEQSSISSAGSPARRRASANGAPRGQPRPRAEGLPRTSSPDPIPDTRIERLLWGRGVQLVAGIDEAGRGAWAGPVVAAAVVLPPNHEALDSLASPSKEACESGFVGVRDSKTLTPRQRTVAAKMIRGVACAVGVGIVPPEIVDEMGLSFAGQLAFWRAVRRLPLVPHYLLVDGFPLWSPRFAQSAVLQGDGRCLSIAAASIIAKTTRDGIMIQLDHDLPGYGFAHNVGYGTAEHGNALRSIGPTSHHRRTWAPVAAICGSSVVQDADVDELDR
jgi:ribonuclease HII